MNKKELLALLNKTGNDDDEVFIRGDNSFIIPIDNAIVVSGDGKNEICLINGKVEIPAEKVTQDIKARYYDDIKSEFLEEIKQFFNLKVLLYFFIFYCVVCSILIFMYQVKEKVFSIVKYLQCDALIIINGFVGLFIIEFFLLGLIIVSEEKYRKNFWFLMKCLLKRKEEK